MVVCEFYGMVRNVVGGLYGGRSVEGVWWDFLRVREGMFYARSGAGGIYARMEHVRGTPVFRRERKMSLPGLSSGDGILDGDEEKVVASPSRMTVVESPVVDVDEAPEVPAKLEVAGDEDEGGDLGGSGLVYDDEEEGEEETVEIEEEETAEVAEGNVEKEEAEEEKDGSGSSTPIRTMPVMDSPW